MRHLIEPHCCLHEDVYKCASIKSVDHLCNYAVIVLISVGSAKHLVFCATSLVPGRKGNVIVQGQFANYKSTMPKQGSLLHPSHAVHSHHRRI